MNGNEYWNQINRNLLAIIKKQRSRENFLCLLKYCGRISCLILILFQTIFKIESKILLTKLNNKTNYKF